MEVVYYVACSLDGFIAARDGGADWLHRFVVDGEDYGYGDFYASVDAVLMGSKTYEDALERGHGQSFDRPCLVFTSRELPLADDSVMLTPESPRDVVRALATAGHRRAWLMGGGRLAASFRAASLITRYMICLVPTLIGPAIPLFAEADGTTDVRLVESQSFSSGAVMLTYEPTETVEPAS